jgi:ankyrin repeat protein
MDIFEEVVEGRIDNVRFLLDRGVDPNSRGGILGGTCLMQACIRNLRDIAILLLERG